MFSAAVRDNGIRAANDSVGFIVWGVPSMPFHLGEIRIGFRPGDCSCFP